MLHTLGVGGFGKVVCALQTGPMGFRRKVAIKRLRGSSASRRSEDALIAEARLGGLLRHKNIVAIYNLEEDDDGWLVVMEYVEGITLATLLARCRERGEPLPRESVIDIAAQACAGLEHAHSLLDDSGHRLGLVHRDFKPSNVMLTSDGLVKIMDFGIARTERWADPMAGLVAGTSKYMSPEQQANSEGQDHRSDLFSLGVVLFELLTLATPPTEPTELREALKEVDGDLSELLVQALAPAPRDRFESAATFGAALRSMGHAPTPIHIGSVVGTFQPDRTEAVPGGIDGLGSSRAEVGTSSGRRPYRGLRGFEVRDGSTFFGRDEESRRLAQRIVSEPMVTVTGVSGVGKSSLLRAGVTPLLPERTFCWCRPGTDPIASLLVALGESPSHREELADDPSAIFSLVGPSLVLVVDQAEELFTLCEPSRARAMAAIIARLAESEAVRVVLVVREDFFVQLVTMAPLGRVAQRAVEVVAPPGREELQDVLCRPLDSFGYRFEDDTLVEEILDVVGEEPAALALLQFCADRLWDERETDGRLLLRSSYRSIGGVTGALAHHAEEVYQTLSSSQRGAFRDLMMKLVTVEGTRQPLRFRELTETARDAHLTAMLLDHLVAVRLVNAREGVDGDTVIEVVHEALIEQWGRLSRWRSQDRDGLVFRQNLQQAVASWSQRGRSADLLWRGELLVEYRLWRQRDQAPLSRAEQEFIARSVTHEQRGRRRLVVAVGVGLVAMVGLTSWALEGWRSARASSVQALVAQHLAEGHAQEAKIQADLNRAAFESLRGNPGVATQITRRILAEHPDDSGAMEGLYAAVSGRQERHILTGHTAAVRGVVFSPDGRHLLSVSMDQTAKLYGRDGALQVEFQGHDGLLHSGRFSPDGTRVLTASRDHTARVWTLEGEALTVLDHAGGVLAAEWSPDGRYIATTSLDTTAKIWSSDGQLLRVLPHDSFVVGVVWSSDGERVFTSSGAGLSGWSVAEGHRLWSGPTRESGGLLDLSPSGQHLLLSSWNGSREVWTLDGELLDATECGTRYPFGDWHPTEERALGCRVDDPTAVAVLDERGREVLALSHHPEDIFGAHFSPDARRIAVIGKEGAVSLWEADGTLIAHLDGHQSEVVSAAWSPDSMVLATASDDNTVRIWSGDGSVPGVRDLGRPIDGMAWSPDGARVLSLAVDDHGSAMLALDGIDGATVTTTTDFGVVPAAYWSPKADRFALRTTDGRVGLWQASGAFMGLLEGEGVRDLSWHPTGEVLWGATLDQGFLRWEPSGQSQPALDGGGTLVSWAPDGEHWVSFDGARTLTVRGRGDAPDVEAPLEQSSVTQICWRAEGDRFAAVGSDGTLGIWHVSGERIAQQKLGSSRIADCEWSPDGDLLAVASWDRRVLLLRADGSLAAELVGHTRAVAGVEWRPDGSELVSAGWDTTARVWTRKGEHRWELRDLHEGERMVASWSPDGRWLATSAMGDPRLRILPGTRELLLEKAYLLVPTLRDQE